MLNTEQQQRLAELQHSLNQHLENAITVMRNPNFSNSEYFQNRYIQEMSQVGYYGDLIEQLTNEKQSFKIVREINPVDYDVL